MKANIKKSAKEKTLTGNNTRPHTAKKAGYTEEVYNHEQQVTYQKSKDAKGNKKNTAGPKS